MTTPGKRVVLRDGAIFLLKLWLDGLKDFALTFAAVIALIIDVVLRRGNDHFLFYRVVRAGERFELWLNLYGAAKVGPHSEEGFFAGSRAGEDTFLGKLEELTGGERGRKRER